MTGGGYLVRLDGVEGAGGEFVQAAGETVLRAALRAGVGFPYECLSGGCGSCRFQVIGGEIADRWPEAPGRSERDRRTGRFLGCQCSAASDLCIKVRPSGEYVPEVTPERGAARLVELERVTHDISRFVFQSDRPARFRAGQYATVTIPGVGQPRCYSMSNLANPDGYWEFIIRRVPGGRATTVLFDGLEVGREVEIDGPYGLAGLRTDQPRDIACVAGGSGLAPMVSIARGAADAGLLDDHVLHFFYGARSAADVCGETFLGELDGFGSRIRFHPVVSMPETTGSSEWDGETGFVHEAACRILVGRLADHEWYFAGPPPMTQALLDALAVQHLVPVDQLHFDRFF